MPENKEQMRAALGRRNTVQELCTHWCSCVSTSPLSPLVHSPPLCSLHLLRYCRFQSDYRPFIYLAQGPSYKRGPPKGYIHAIEQRWHQVESLLGAILQCPDARVQSFVNDLKQDDLAREIIDRVDMGPYVRPIIPT